MLFSWGGEDGAALSPSRPGFRWTMGEAAPRRLLGRVSKPGHPAARPAAQPCCPALLPAAGTRGALESDRGETGSAALTETGQEKEWG